METRGFSYIFREYRKRPVILNWVNPVDTRRRFNVYKTSIRRCRRRIDVLYTLKRRRVSTGKDVQFTNIRIKAATGGILQNTRS